MKIVGDSLRSQVLRMIRKLLEDKARGLVDQFSDKILAKRDRERSWCIESQTPFETHGVLSCFAYGGKHVFHRYTLLQAQRGSTSNTDTRIEVFDTQSASSASIFAEER